MTADWEHGHGRRRRRVRPYAMTKGRTQPDGADLELEALVATTTLGEQVLPTLRLEQRAIVNLCRHPISVAEISAHLDVPLGVARIMAGDMAAEGLVLVHRPVHPGDQPDPALLERILQRLRTL